MLATLQFAGILCILAVYFAQGKMLLEGTDKRCNKEGEAVTIPGITDDICIDCFCRKGHVACERQSCVSMEGCHAILHHKPEHSCCDVCKGCSQNSTEYASGATWTDPADRCQLYHCEAGVLTRTTKKCYVNCDEPVHIPGECCPSCSGCFFEGVDRLDGETFPLQPDPGVVCKCKAGRVTCSYSACPVLNCPDDAVFKTNEKSCPVCKGQRKVFNLPTSCFFAKRIYSHGTLLKPDVCTSCVCWGGTVHCDRKTCLPPACDVKDHVHVDGSCCPHCKQHHNCFYKNHTYQAGEHWTDRDTCHQCHCSKGAAYCSRQVCDDSVVCPQGFSLKTVPGSCCPICVEDDTVCTVTSNSRHRTFDGHEFNALGSCRYHLLRPCNDDKNKNDNSTTNAGNSFFVKIRNGRAISATEQPEVEFWTELVTIGIGKNLTINLYRTLLTRVNRQRISLPFTIHASTLNGVGNINDNGNSVGDDGVVVLHQVGNSVVVDASEQLGFKVVWDGRSRLEVTASKAHQNKVCGLCGNNNADPWDDLRDKRGALVSDSARFLQAWRVRGVCHKPRGPAPADLVAACRPGSAGAIRAEEHCTGFFHDEVRACSSRIDIVPYIRSCLHDSCKCPQGGSCHERSIRSLSRRCKRAGFHVRWWRVAR